jgi:endonuclease IV
MVELKLTVTHPGPSKRGTRETALKKASHVINGRILEDLAVVDVPDGLVVPNFAGQQNGAQGDSLPTAWSDVDLGVF